MKIVPSGLRFRLVTLVIAALAPFLILIALVARQHQTNERGETEQRAKEVAAKMAQRLDGRVGTMEMAMLALKHSLSARPERLAENDLVLRQFARDLPREFAQFAVVSPAGTNIGTSDSVLSGARRPIDFRATAEPMPLFEFRLVGPVRLYGDSGPQSLALVYELDNAGSRLIGFLPVSALQRDVLSKDLPDGSVAAVVNEAGDVVGVSRNSSYWTRLKLSPARFSPPDSTTGVGLLRGPNRSTLYSAYAKMQHAPFRVYVGTPESVAFAKARNDFWRAVGWGTLALLLGVSLAWTQATRIIRPLEQLAADAAILGRGELGHRSEVRSSDELGRLAGSINAMAETLERHAGEALQTHKMESVGQLAGGIAHDFNNLLTVISGRLELLAASGTLTADERDDIGEIRVATTRAVALTRQLLAFSRKQILRPKVVDLNVILDEIEPMLRRLIGEDVQIVISRGAHLGRILADPGQVHQVLLNLSLNARDAMPAGGLLRIETSNEQLGEEMTFLAATLQPGDYVVASVTDTGSGMDDRIRARIFDPFFTTKAAGKGTGLGLATVYGIVKQSGASITVDSAPGRGTTFRVYFPRAARAISGEHPVPAQLGPRGTETILLVEDERAVRDLVFKILAAHGYDVISAAHGGDALQITVGSERHIHLLLTDVVMPGMSGRELVETLRTGRPKLKVLYMSGYTDDEIVRRGLLDPSVAFIQKPFTAEEIALKVRRTLDA